MLLGLLAVPLLAAIYWFRSRSRRVVVSSLMLWTDPRRPRQGGQLLRHMQAPLSFFLELLAIALVVVAAAGPAMVRKDVARPLLVVLDDSYSMLAQDPGRPGALGAPRGRAEAALVEELGGDNYLARFLLAGAEPRLLGEPLRTVAEARQVLAAWTCQSPGADLQRGIALAAEVGGPNARILVLSDQAPPVKLEGGQVQWWAFGAKLPNMAITAALRSASGENQRALVEVTNLSDAPGRTTLTLEGGNLASPKSTAVELAAGAARQFFLDLPAGSPLLTATLGDDVLEIDNKVVLLPESTSPVRVSVDLGDAGLRRAVDRVLTATGMALQVSERPDLIVCDGGGTRDEGRGARGEVQEGGDPSSPAPPPDAWRLEILGGKDAAAYAGPFVVDRTHPLAQGLSLDGAIWSASPQAVLSGPAIVTAGNVTLLTDREDGTGRHRLQMSFAPELSNLQDIPDWPILFANLLRWRRGAAVGAQSPNVRLGQNVAVTLAEDAKRVEVVPPAGPAWTLDVHNRRVEVPAERVGLYTVKAPGAAYQFSCNAVSRDESDLSRAETGRWGDRSGSPVHMDRQISIRWVFLLLALGCLAVHLWVIGGQGSGFRVQEADARDEGRESRGHADAGVRSEK
jgi:hypothetical protein